MNEKSYPFIPLLEMLTNEVQSPRATALLDVLLPGVIAELM